jgi:hypothetical protein
MKRKYYQERNEVIRFENQVIISKIAFRMVHGQAYKRFQKLPCIPILVIGH